MRSEISAFGEYMADRMKSLSLSLREVSRRSGIDAANLSRIERGVVYPPQKPETLKKLAEALRLNQKETKRFFDLSAAANGVVPTDLSHVRRSASIPLLLRAIDNRKLSEVEIENLAKAIEQENSWQGRVEE